MPIYVLFHELAGLLFRLIVLHVLFLVQCCNYERLWKLSVTSCEMNNNYFYENLKLVFQIPAALQQPAYQGYSDTQQGRKRACLFHAIIDMMAVAEGGIIHSSDPEFNSAVSNALYGILINGDSRIIYDKVLGLDIVDLENSDK